ncbi:MAG: selenide, water dikinase SelD [Alphaproteobacteria bacterium]|nr:selenide, water dikinase SelD [Alphaproteobacteria bacterium]
MKQMPADAIDLVLIGGGHAQIAVLKAFGMRPLEGVRLTLVTDVLMAPYSGMLPGYVEGHHSLEDMHINLLKLARFAGARLIKRAVSDIDFDKQNIVLDGGLNLHYDVLSLNNGAVPAPESIKGTALNGITVKPISHFLEKMPDASALRGDFGVIGGGAAGCELAISLYHHYQLGAKNIALHLFSRSERVLPTAPKKASMRMQSALARHNITIHHRANVEEITSDTVILEAGNKIPAAHIFVVTAARPASWISNLKLSHCEDGYISVRPTLQTVEYDNVFAAGDVASMVGEPREKAGVFAVRAGPYLAFNLRSYIEQTPLKSFSPQTRYLALIGLGGKNALALRGNFVAQGAFWWHLKNWIDRRFMQKFNNLPEMVTPPTSMPAYAKKLTDKPVQDVFECAGCGAKAGADILRDALEEACNLAREKGVDERFLPPAGIASDYSHLPLPDDSSKSTQLSQSVDFISQHISDSYLFGRIAVLHALSDVFVAGDKPFAAQALVTLQRTRPEMQKSDLAMMLSGALEELAAHRTKLIGGHTTIGSEAMLGFAVTGLSKADKPSPALPKTEDVMLVLTKPIGIGIVLAAEMRGICAPDSYDAALAAMLASNARAANIIISAAPSALMTDVTGFGLARHGLNLAQRAEATGMELWLDSLPLLIGAKELAASGTRSSLFSHNRQDIAVQGGAMLGTEYTPLIELLFDPQTSGGILAALPRSKAHEICGKLQEAGYIQAEIIGRLSQTQSGITVVKEAQEAK